jgi:predicted glycosyltransferase
MTAAELQPLIEQSACILARSGYSTVMDLSRLGKRAILIPTPGQTEQKYLADRLENMRIAHAVEQCDFDLPRAWQQVEAYTGFPEVGEDDRALRAALDELLTQAPAMRVLQDSV